MRGVYHNHIPQRPFCLFRRTPYHGNRCQHIGYIPLPLNAPFRPSLLFFVLLQQPIGILQYIPLRLTQ